MRPVLQRKTVALVIVVLNNNAAGLYRQGDNLKDGRGWARAPAVDQQFRDDAGNYWHVRDVFQSPDQGNYYVVRISYGTNPTCSDGVAVLGRGEFSALCENRKLQLVQGDKASNDENAGGSPSNENCNAENRAARLRESFRYR